MTPETDRTLDRFFACNKSGYLIAQFSTLKHIHGVRIVIYSAIKIPNKKTTTISL